MAGPEATIERWVAHEAELHGIPNAKWGVHGWPDRVFFLPRGKPLLIEFKAPGEPLKPRQGHRAEQLRRLGYDLEVHDDKLVALEAVLRRLKEVL